MIVACYSAKRVATALCGCEMQAELVITHEDAGQRLDVILKNALPEYSRARLQKLIKNGGCVVNGRVELAPDYKPEMGAKVEISGGERGSTLAASRGELEILWRDEHVAVLNKPAGLTVHPCPSCQEETLVHRMLAYFPELASQGGERPGIVHRLDKDTSGLILIALTERARMALAKAFAERRIHKRYLALAAGEPPEQGECKEPIGRHPTLKTRMAIVEKKHGGREAHTKWCKLWQGREQAILAVDIFTGRTHQIRVHLAHLGFPLLGDDVYAPPAIAAKALRQMLHAWQLVFIHPATGEQMRFAAMPPEDFFAAAIANNRRMERLVVTGNQGCGKSSFCRQLVDAGLPGISADAIVAKLYGPHGMASDWIGSHFGQEALSNAGAVDKPALFQILRQKPHMRKELEKAVHGMVLAEIEDFWQANAACEATCAEVPLYFESGYSGMITPAPWLVGVSCPEPMRWRRLAQDRGWSKEKIAEIESWQWPEDRKMAACNEVIVNAGTVEELRGKAQEFLARLKERLAGAETALLEHLRALVAPSPKTAQ